jgi:hypothetical protein
MTSTLCITCRKPKANYTCGLCQACSCKSCTHFIGEDNFAFLKKVPADLKHLSYCSNCFDEKVSAPLNDYNDKYERAKDIIIYTKEESKLTRFLKRKAEVIRVDDCEDQQEALMKMSFEAVEGNYNALIDIEYKTKKVVLGSHKKTLWSASAVPINIEPGSIRAHRDPP